MREYNRNDIYNACSEMRRDICPAVLIVKRGMKSPQIFGRLCFATVWKTHFVSEPSIIASRTARGSDESAVMTTRTAATGNAGRSEAERPVAGACRGQTLVRSAATDALGGRSECPSAEDLQIGSGMLLLLVYGLKKYRISAGSDKTENFACRRAVRAVSPQANGSIVRISSFLLDEAEGG